jgi:DNA-binding XRE family transcriptional regulator
MVENKELLAMKSLLIQKAGEGGLVLPTATSQVRRSLGLTRSQFANQLGVSASRLGAIERGDANPSYKTLLAIASAAGLKVGFVLP